MSRELRIAILEPYYGGSHAAFVDAYIAHSRHTCALATLPARKWKWRMRGAAIFLAGDDMRWQEIDCEPPDLILCNDMLSVADLRALLPGQLARVPIACYFHENQLTYPIPEEQQRDYQYGMTNITSCMAADAVWFNTRFHLEDFLQAAGGLLAKMPDFVPPGLIAKIRAKAEVIPPPVAAPPVPRKTHRVQRPPTILWCHRWEFDKNPEPFFTALLRLAGENVPFKLVLLGEQFRTAPAVFAESWERLRPHIVHTGFVADRGLYLEMLARCDLVVSSAIQENFGIGVIEATLAGCQPLLPDRLAYPEIIPSEYHERCLYPGDSALYKTLREALVEGGLLPPHELSALRRAIENKYGLTTAVKRLDDAAEALLAAKTR